MNKRPCVRPIEAINVEFENQLMMSLNDPERLVENSLLVSLPAFFLVTLMDGHRGVDQICEEFYNQFRQRVRPEDVLGLIEQLDNAFLLDNERYSLHRKSIRNDFVSSPQRPPFFAGKSYTDNVEELISNIDALLESGEPAAGKAAESVVAPHIDFQVGSDMMGAGWRALKNSDAELFIILGVGHTLTEDFFSCIDKDFSTPAGTMKVDRDFLRAFEINFGEKIFNHMDAHRNEHSIEFQSLFLARLARDNPNISSVPVLLSFPEIIWSLDHPVFNGGRIEKFIESLKKTVAEDGRKTCYVASVDFSHVGARFGDSEKLDDATLTRIRRDDHELIDCIRRVDPAGFVQKIAETNQSNRVCGFPALYALLKLTQSNRGELIEYRQNIEGDNDSVVSFATMALYA